MHFTEYNARKRELYRIASRGVTEQRLLAKDVQHAAWAFGSKVSRVRNNALGTQHKVIAQWLTGEIDNEKKTQLYAQFGQVAENMQQIRTDYAALFRSAQTKWDAYDDLLKEIAQYVADFLSHCSVAHRIAPLEMSVQAEIEQELRVAEENVAVKRARIEELYVECSAILKITKDYTTSLEANFSKLL